MWHTEPQGSAIWGGEEPGHGAKHAKDACSLTQRLAQKRRCTPGWRPERRALPTPWVLRKEGRRSKQLWQCCTRLAAVATGVCRPKGSGPSLLTTSTELSRLDRSSQPAAPRPQLPQQPHTPTQRRKNRDSLGSSMKAESAARQAAMPPNEVSSRARRPVRSISSAATMVKAANQ